MKVNGYALRTAIRNREIERNSMVSALASSLSGDDGPSPEELMAKIEECEKTIAKLQTFQAEYNLTVTFVSAGEEISMTEAIKRIGGLERVLQQWRRLMSCPSGMVLAGARRLDVGLAARKAKQYAMEASVLHGSMSVANSVEVDIPDLDGALIE